MADGLDDPAARAHAWRRYRRLLRWMALFTLLVVLAALAALDLMFGPLHWVTVLAAIGGFGGTAMLTAALMGLVFMSSGTGHDEDVDRR
ncbi:MAG: hypothetical protein A4S12_13590 [Proteobacteria bacterium SG_bin5]|nr:hypothetical protein [Sphingomonas sp.]OQW44343.1 MAG: hypothetical protein A4S12_13590 [Proteobacteria bacterium SG_bin5]